MKMSDAERPARWSSGGGVHPFKRRLRFVQRMPSCRDGSLGAVARCNTCDKAPANLPAIQVNDGCRHGVFPSLVDAEFWREADP